MHGLFRDRVKLLAALKALAMRYVILIKKIIKLLHFTLLHFTLVSTQNATMQM